MSRYASPHASFTHARLLPPPPIHDLCPMYKLQKVILSSTQIAIAHTPINQRPDQIRYCPGRKCIPGGAGSLRNEHFVRGKDHRIAEKNHPVGGVVSHD